MQLRSSPRHIGSLNGQDNAQVPQVSRAIESAAAGIDKAGRDFEHQMSKVH